MFLSRFVRCVLLCVVASTGPALSAQAPVAPSTRGTFDAKAASRFAQLALSCVHREYPNKISHVLQSGADAKQPRVLTPVFFGCYDWHSAVHGHWLLARLVRRYPRANFVKKARDALARSFQDAKVAVELTYLKGQGRTSFERPYGLAWLLQLSAELHGWEDAQAQAWAKTLDPVVDLAVARFLDWFPKLTHPIRTGEHSQTAFAMGLILDWARARRHARMTQLIVARGRAYYGKDRGWSFRFEPGGQDFLSPGLAEADFMRRVMAPEEFATWLGGFLPELPVTGSADWLAPAIVTDKTDGKLAHLDGLNLSRAWMLEGIASGLPATDPRRRSLLGVARAHRTAGLAAVTGEHYAGGHWLGSFAVYLVTNRGLPARRR